MSCPTWLRLENLKEGTQKRIYINLGWVPPTDFQMAEILINAVKEVSDTYEWERLYFPWMGSTRYFDICSLNLDVKRNSNIFLNCQILRCSTFN